MGPGGSKNDIEALAKSEVKNLTEFRDRRFGKCASIPAAVTAFAESDWADTATGGRERKYGRSMSLFGVYFAFISPSHGAYGRELRPRLTIGGNFAAREVFNEGRSAGREMVRRKRKESNATSRFAPRFRRPCSLAVPGSRAFPLGVCFTNESETLSKPRWPFPWRVIIHAGAGEPKVEDEVKEMVNELKELRDQGKAMAHFS